MGTIHTYKCTRTSSSFPGSAWNALHGRLLPPVQRPCSPSTQNVPLRFVLARKTRSRLCTVGGIKPTLMRSANGNNPHVQMYANTTRELASALRLGLSQRKRDLQATSLSKRINLLRHHRHFADGTVTFGLPHCEHLLSGLLKKGEFAT